MEKILFWESCEKTDGRYHGDIIPPTEAYESIDTFEFAFKVFPGVPGKKAEEIENTLTANLDEVREMTDYELGNYVDQLAGVDGKTVYEDYFISQDILGFDMDERTFFDVSDIPTVRAYDYFKNTNRTTIILDETKTEYELEVLGTYNLDYQEKGPNSTDFTYGGMGEHASLKKVREGDQEYLLMHLWSQWQGSELDSGYLLTADEALEELENHPEIEEIREWLK